MKSFTQYPEDLVAYGPLLSQDGKRSFALRLVEMPTPELLIVACEGLADRTQAEKLRGTELYLPRDVFPAPEEDEFYHIDLIGMKAIDETGKPVGTVLAVHNYGAGDFLELKSEEGDLTLPFTREAVPTVNMQEKSLTLVRAFLLDSRVDSKTADQEEGAPA